MHYLGKCHFNWVTHSLEFQECGVFFIYFVSCLIAVFSKASHVFQIDRKNTLFSAEMGFTEKQVPFFKGRNFDIDCKKDGNGKNNFFHANFWLPNKKKIFRQNYANQIDYSGAVHTYRQRVHEWLVELYKNPTSHCLYPWGYRIKLPDFPHITNLHLVSKVNE